MTDKIKRLFKGLIKNKEFLADIKQADNDDKPSFFASNTEKSIYAAIYYGWKVWE